MNLIRGFLIGWILTNAVFFQLFLHSPRSAKFFLRQITAGVIALFLIRLIRLRNARIK